MKNLNKVLENASLFKKIESDHERKSYKKRCNFDEKGMSVHVATGNTIYITVKGVVLEINHWPTHS